MVWIAILLAATGALGVIVGVRGRVVGRSLDCAHCGYDLRHMQRTPQSRCPECGHGVWVGAVFHAARQRNRALITRSFGCITLAGAFATVHVLQQWEVIDWHRWRRVDALVKQIGASTSAEPHRRAWSELSRRHQAQLLSDDELGDIMAIALDRHLAMLRPLSERSDSGSSLNAWLAQPQPEHLQWIQLACTQNLLPSAATTAYLQRLFQPTVSMHIPAQVGAHQPLFVWLHPKPVEISQGWPQGNFVPSTLGAGGSAEVIVMLDEVLIDGETLPLDDWDSMVFPVEFTSTMRKSAAWNLAVPLRQPRGHYEVTVRCKVGVTQLTIGEPPNTLTLGQPLGLGTTWPRTLFEFTTQSTRRVQVR